MVVHVGRNAINVTKTVKMRCLKVWQFGRLGEDAHFGFFGSMWYLQARWDLLSTIINHNHMPIDFTDDEKVV